MESEAGDAGSFYEALAVATLRDHPISVTLAKPFEPDCPLIGCSDGFLALTGFAREDIVGRNCRFLNSQCHISSEDRIRMRVTVRKGRPFTGVLDNKTKSHKPFRNFLHMRVIRIGPEYYIVGIQADVTHTAVNLAQQDTLREIKSIVDEIFHANVDAWAAQQASRFSFEKEENPLTYSKSILQPRSNTDQYIKARDSFVSLEDGLNRGTALRSKNTFLEVEDSEDEDCQTLVMGLRKVASEPCISLRFPGIQRQVSPTSDWGITDVIDSFGGNQDLGFDRQTSAPADFPCAETPANVGLQQQFEAIQKNEEAPLKTNSAHRTTSRIFSRQHPGQERVVIARESAGSVDHPDGCTPCSFHCYSWTGCKNGDDCEFCHLEHPRRTRRRCRAKKRAGKSETDDVGEAAEDEEDQANPLASLDSLPSLNGVDDKSKDSSSVVSSVPTAAARLRQNLHIMKALEMLSPLPLIPTQEAGGFSGYATSSDALPPLIEPPGLAATSGLSSSSSGYVDNYEASRGGRHSVPQYNMPVPPSAFVLQYSEAAVVVETLQYMCILPFLSDFAGMVSFRVVPPLPRGIVLDASTGVIAGIPTMVTGANGGVYTVLAESNSHSAWSTIHLTVLDPEIEATSL